jgi:bacteriocin-like protein
MRAEALTPCELSEAELDAVSGGEGGVSGLFQTVAPRRCRAQL